MTAGESGNLRRELLGAVLGVSILATVGTITGGDTFVPFGLAFNAVSVSDASAKSSRLSANPDSIELFNVFCDGPENCRLFDMISYDLDNSSLH